MTWKDRMDQIKWWLNCRKDRLQNWIAWKTPRWLVYRAAIRIFVHGTSGEYSFENVANLKMLEALNRWEKKVNKFVCEIGRDGEEPMVFEFEYCEFSRFLRPFFYETDDGYCAQIETDSGTIIKGKRIK